MSLCPLSMISGKPYRCEGKCEHCPPQALEKIASYSEYLSCLNYPNDMFGNGMAESGLGSIADAIDHLADSMQND